MENVTAIDNPSRPARSLRPSEPLYPCTALPRRFWEQCYDWQITYALFVNDSDFRTVFGLCAEQAGGRARVVLPRARRRRAAAEQVRDGAGGAPRDARPAVRARP